MNPINFAGPMILAALVAVATLLHWDMRARGISVRHFGACSSEWREMALRRAAYLLGWR